MTLVEKPPDLAQLGASWSAVLTRHTWLVGNTTSRRDKQVHGAHDRHEHRLHFGTRPDHSVHVLASETCSSVLLPAQDAEGRAIALHLPTAMPAAQQTCLSGTLV